MKINKAFLFIIILFLLFIFYLLFNPFGDKPDDRTKVAVNCSQGDSLSNIVKNARAGSLIIINDECSETDTVEVTQDGIVIDGQGSTLTAENEDRAVIKVSNGAKNVVIMNITVKGGHHGFHIDEGSSALLRDIVVLEGSGAGLLIGSKSPFDTAEDYETVPEKIQSYHIIEKWLPDIEFKLFREAMAQLDPNYPAYCINPLQSTLDLFVGTTILCSGDIQSREYGIAIINSDLGSANLSVIGNYSGSTLSGLTLLSNTYAGIAVFGQSSVYFYSGQIAFIENGHTHYAPLATTFSDLWTQTGSTIACTPELIAQNAPPNFGNTILSERTDGIPNVAGGMDYQCFP